MDMTDSLFEQGGTGIAVDDAMWRQRSPQPIWLRRAASAAKA
jgi:hypothetical protein